MIAPLSLEAGVSTADVPQSHQPIVFETGTQASSGLLEGMLVATSPLKSSGSNVVVTLFRDNVQFCSGLTMEAAVKTHCGGGPN